MNLREKLPQRARGFFLGATVTLVIIVLCMWLVDLPLASWIATYPSTKALYVRTANMPDLLLIFVAVSSALSWSAYFWRVHRNIHDRHTLFCRVTGTVLPVSFALKSMLKWGFGRTETRTWLSDQSLYGYHWFAGTDGFQGFPSGHMLVLTPLFLAIWNFYPRCRLIDGVAWFGLGVALITTDYHFLSDVLAGASIGAIVFLVVEICGISAPSVGNFT